MILRRTVLWQRFDNVVLELWLWRGGARARTRWRLGFRFAGEAEREREGKVSEGRERARGDLILSRLGSGWTELRARGGGATLAVATGAGVEDDRGFPDNPLEFSFLFPSSPFLF